MTKLVIQQNSFGDITRIGLYENNKWIKWIKKKELDLYVDAVDQVENINI